VKWNGGASFPIQTGHGCIGCAEPGFWDKGSFYTPLSGASWGKAGEAIPLRALELAAAAAAAGAAVGAGAALLGRNRQSHLAATEKKEE
jgi:hydrogenase small subunit